MDEKRIGSFIKTLRKEKGLTQEQLAEALFVSSKTVSRWETGSVLPDLNTLQTLASFFGVDIKELLYGERNPDDSAEKETIRRLSEYAETKEQRGIRKAWKVLIFVLLGVAAVIAAVLMIQYCGGKQDSGKQPVGANPAWGPLEELKENYSALQAENDGCIVLAGNDLKCGEQHWLDFTAAVRKKTAAIVRIYQIDSSDSISYTLKELSFNGDTFTLKYYERRDGAGLWHLNESIFRYLSEETYSNYSHRTYTVLLADSPDAEYKEWLSRVYKMTSLEPKYDPAYAHCHALMEWECSEHPELLKNLYDACIVDNDRDGDAERYLLNPYVSSDQIGCIRLTAYRSNGELLGSSVYQIPILDRPCFIWQEYGDLYLQTKFTVAGKEQVTLYRVLLNENGLFLEKDGTTLAPAFTGWGHSGTPAY